MKLPEVRRFRKILRRFEQSVALQLKGSSCCCGVTMAQCHALLEIELHEEVSLGELARLLGLDKSTLSRTIEGLVNVGLAARTTDPADRRSVRLSLTDQGRRTCDRINTNNDALYGRVLQRIDPQHRTTLLDSFQMLVEAMQAETETDDCGCAAAR